MRTQEQIHRDIDRRFEELKREAESPARVRPCQKCRHFAGYKYPSIKETPKCRNPLVKGFEKRPVPLDFGSMASHLCGPEKALWEPKWNPFREAWVWFTDMLFKIGVLRDE